MPKQLLKLEDFSGGVNGIVDPQNILDIELAQCSGFKAERGEVFVLGDMKAAYTLGTLDDDATENIDIEAGYGIFTFSHDYDMDSSGVVAALNPTNYFIQMSRISGSPQNHLNIYDDVLHTWRNDLINLGASLSNAAMAIINPCFFFVDGTLRISPGDFNSVLSGSDTNSALGAEPEYGNVSQGGTINVSDTYVADGDIIERDGIEFLKIEATILARNMTGSFPGAVSTGAVRVRPDTKWRGVVHRKAFQAVTTIGTFSEWYTTYMHPRSPINHETTYTSITSKDIIPFTVETFTANDFSDRSSAPLMQLGFYNATANADATWDGKYRMIMTALYDDSKQESQGYRVMQQNVLNPGFDLAIVIAFQYSTDTSTYMVNKRVTGARLYYEDQVDEPGTFYQLMEIDFEKGCKKAESEKFEPWVVLQANERAICPHADGATATNRTTPTNAFIFENPPRSFTYEINNGYSMDTNTHARFKTAVVANRRTYVGNVYQGGVAHGDRMLKSPPNKFDLLPETNFIDVAVGDGDEIVKLETFADKLLQFKKRTLYIINIGGEVEFLESQHKNMGVENPSQTCMTEFGVAWVNKFGVYLYDGQAITELTRGKLKVVDVTDVDGTGQEHGRARALNVTESKIPLIGYHPLNKWLIVHPNSFAHVTVTGTTYTFADSNPDTILDSGNGFVTAGFKARDVITVSGSSASGNNTTHIVDIVAAGTLTLSGASSLTADASAGETVTIKNNPATEAWIHDFKNGSWTWSQEFTATADFKTNLINTHDNELVFAAGTNSTDQPDFFKLQASTNAPAQDKLFLLTKDFTLEIPSVKKNVYSVFVTYSAAASTAIQADLIYKTSSGSTTVAMTSASALYHDDNGFASTSNAKTTIELTPSSAVSNAYSFQLKLSNDAAAYQAADNFKLYNISFRYRTKGVH